MNSIRKLEITATEGRGDGDNQECSQTFTINDEDHTLANALRYMIMKNPNVLFCGYTIPHPSEIKVNFRIQTNKNETALEALAKGLRDLNEVCAHVMQTFEKSVQEHAHMEH